MSTRNLINLVLLVIVAILVLVVIYEPGKAPPTTQTLTTLDEKTIHRIHISRTGQADVSLQRTLDASGQPGHWQMTAPFHVQANRIKAESLLGLLKQKSLADYSLEGLDIKSYGLDHPRASITFNDKWKFEFGSTEPINQHRYLRLNNHLYVIDDHFYYQLMSPVTVFVDHQLLTTGEPIKKMILPDFSLSLHDGGWRIAPARNDFSNDQANELIENWRSAHAMHIEEYKPATQAKQVQVYLQDHEKPIVFDIIIHADKFFLGRADLGLKYQIAKDNQRQLLQLPPRIETPDVDTQDPTPQTNDP